ncbi:MAG: hypothetical protein U5L09_06400 [Bacteroidales bacterium]|nr:hypothetical protein [Bacteroidales bacterium]
MLRSGSSWKNASANRWTGSSMEAPVIMNPLRWHGTGEKILSCSRREKGDSRHQGFIAGKQHNDVK